MKVFNTLSGQKEEFLSQGEEVRMYVCGVTPYSDAHIGHAMSYIIFDVIRRYLQFRGHKVKYVQNITDIDDKIIDRANQRGIPIRELSDKFTDSFFKDMRALNVGLPDIQPRATEEIPKMIEVIQGLVDKGYAYPAQGSVYFRVRSVADYGKLSHRNLESMMAGARIEAGEEKEHPMDFVLWKASKPGEPSWESPWGNGRPGWHIECSAMSLKYLGDTLDIHGGGQDLIFPHHENEIAQAEGFTGKKPFVKYWLHNGLVQIGEEKMSKSLGNLITINEALEKYSADAIRLFVLSSHYRSPLTYSEKALEAAERGVERLRQAANLSSPEGPLPGMTFKGQRIMPNGFKIFFTSGMDNDFNTAEALAVLFELARQINQGRDENHNVAEIQDMLRELANVLGLTLKLSEEPTLEAELYKKSLTLEEYAFKSFKDALKQVEAGLPQLSMNESVYNSLLKSLRNKFVHGIYPTLDEAEIHTQHYSIYLTSIRNQLANSAGPQDFKALQECLRALSNSAASNIGSYNDFRNQLREAKQWQLADDIRAKLTELGIALEDTPEKTVWKYKR